MNGTGPDRSGAVDQAMLDRIVREVFQRLNIPTGRTTVNAGGMSSEHGLSAHSRKIPVGVSVRHVHVSPEDLEILFGPGAKLTKLRDLYQPGSYAANETVSLIGPRMRMLERVRILAPMRDRTQVELARTDAVFLGVDAPLRMSGDIAGSAPITIIGPKGVVELKEGCIRAMRHVHMSPRDAEEFHLRNGDKVKIRVGGPSAVTFENVIVRVGENILLEVHLDTDEGNVADVHCNQEIDIIRNGDFKATIQ